MGFGGIGGSCRPPEFRARSGDFGKPARAARSGDKASKGVSLLHAEDPSQPHRNLEPPACDPWAEKGTDRRCLLKLLRSPPTPLVSDLPRGVQGELRASTLLEGKRGAI